MNDKLRSCPFCGSLNLRYEQYKGRVYVVCNDCDSVGGWGDNDDEAARRWNSGIAVKGRYAKPQ